MSTPEEQVRNNERAEKARKAAKVAAKKDAIRQEDRDRKDEIPELVERVFHVAQSTAKQLLDIDGPNYKNASNIPIASSIKRGWLGRLLRLPTHGTNTPELTAWLFYADVDPIALNALYLGRDECVYVIKPSFGGIEPLTREELMTLHVRQLVKLADRLEELVETTKLLIELSPRLKENK